MIQRIISGVVLAVLLVALVLLAPPLWSAAGLSLLLLAAAWEWSGFLAPVAAWQRGLFVLLAVACAAGLWLLSANPAGLRRALLGAALFWTLALLWLVFLPRPVNRAIVWLAGLLALSFAWMALVRMRIDWIHGEHWVMYALCIVWFADSGAYFAGKFLGRRKLAPRVSPGKTWEGFFGGLVAVAVLAVIATPWLSRSLPALVVLSVLIAVYSVVGDLTESLFKRHAGLKDSGTLHPRAWWRARSLRQPAGSGSAVDARRFAAGSIAMMRVAVLGSTGSIGESTLDVACASSRPFLGGGAGGTSQCGAAARTVPAVSSGLCRNRRCLRCGSPGGRSCAPRGSIPRSSPDPRPRSRSRWPATSTA